MSRFTVKQIVEVGDWEAFVRAQPFTPFVQSFHYGDFHHNMGESYWIAGVYEGNTLVGGSLIVSVHARRGNFLYLPYGPLVSPALETSYEEVLRELSGWLKELAKKEDYAFI